jgi:hypothetical protein
MFNSCKNDYENDCKKKKRLLIKQIYFSSLALFAAKQNPEGLAPGFYTIICLIFLRRWLFIRGV